MASVYDKPLPIPFHKGLSEPFWEATKRHEIAMPICKTCSKIFFYPREACPNCTSMDLGWTKLGGKRKVYTYNRVRQAVHPSFQSEHGHIYAIIELDEGPKIPSNIVGCAPEDVFVGMEVSAVFEDVSDEYTLLKFQIT